MLSPTQNLSSLVRGVIRQKPILLAGRCAYYSALRQLEEEEFRKIDEYMGRQRGEPNPEYHHAPRCYVNNFRKHQEQLQVLGEAQTIRSNNPRYRWADFRRRMVYGTYDI
ncbi:hypothetical protein KR009_003783 [Drosophila setifemur]|nr:hypothetical protein KR009_003783 [Drosophila setifemur]